MRPDDFKYLISDAKSLEDRLLAPRSDGSDGQLRTGQFRDRFEVRARL
jgi:hypothetical protein